MTVVLGQLLLQGVRMTTQGLEVTAGTSGCDAVGSGWPQRGPRKFIVDTGDWYSPSSEWVRCHGHDPEPAD